MGSCMDGQHQVCLAAIRFVLDADARGLRQDERQKLLHVSDWTFIISL